MFSWRTAFIVLGAPGIIIALFFLFTVKEPPRGYADPPGTEKAEKMGFAETFTMLSKKPTFWLNTVAASLVAFVGYGVGSLQISYFIRALEMPLTDVALQIAVPAGLAASAGIYIAGYLTEKLSHKIPNAIVIIPGIGLLLSVPLYLIVFSTDSISTAIIALIIAAALHYTYLGAQYTVGQGVASPRARATAIAILLFAVNIIGYAGGPPFVGFLSDLMINAQLASSSFGGQLTPEMCKGGLEALTATIGEAKAQTCISANADGLGRALFYTVMLYAICGLIYLAAAKTLQKDLVAKLD
jgi:sugar phosphate permease